MSHKQGARIQELEKGIKEELEALGIIEVRFYYANPQKPRLEYKSTKSEREVHCEELKRNLAARIQANITGIQRIDPYLDHGRNIQVFELTFAKGYGILDQSTHHGLLSLAYAEIQNHRRRLGI